MFFIVGIIIIIIVVFTYVLICRYNWDKLLKKKPHYNPINNSQQSKRVVIIGAGVSGIAAAKSFIQYGYKDVVILERSEELGGVWNSSQYEG